jgi:hypothetical protein
VEARRFREATSMTDPLGIAPRAGAVAAALGAWVRRGYERARHGDRYVEAVFARIHARNAWGDPESVSGRGSTLARTRVVRRELPRLLATLDARCLLDAPCGDYNWMRAVDLGPVAYIGVDVVPALVERNRQRYGGAGRQFLRLDLTRDPLPAADVVLCRDCLIHLAFADAAAAIANIRRSGARHLIVTTHESVRENVDAPTGGFRALNLRLPPFCFPPPRARVTEDPGTGKSLGVWQLDEL